jgi:hypothetical protein
MDEATARAQRAQRSCGGSTEQWVDDEVEGSLTSLSDPLRQHVDILGVKRYEGIGADACCPVLCGE